MDLSLVCEQGDPPECGGSTPIILVAAYAFLLGVITTEVAS